MGVGTVLGVAGGIFGTAWGTVAAMRYFQRQKGVVWYGWGTTPKSAEMIAGYPKIMVYQDILGENPLFITARIVNNKVNFDQPGAYVKTAEIPPGTEVQVLSWKQVHT